MLADGQAVSRWDMLARLARHADPATHGEPVAMAPPTGTASYVDEQHRLAASQAEHPVSFVTVELPSTQLLGGAGADHLATLGATATLAGGADDELTGATPPTRCAAMPATTGSPATAAPTCSRAGPATTGSLAGPVPIDSTAARVPTRLDGDGDEDTLAGAPATTACAAGRTATDWKAATATISRRRRCQRSAGRRRRRRRARR
ncbi:MAG: hypothetical protein IPG28_12370 [Betaproteobacteria bacterium]|nr:hypothetical protein [Betaproteobacteria bacterium]